MGGGGPFYENHTSGYIQPTVREVFVDLKDENSFIKLVY